jgi:hypothetical protein
MYIFTMAWWRYVLDDSRASRDYGTRWSRFICRWRGHPAGVYFYNVGGTEPDMRCKGCGEDLG